MPGATLRQLGEKVQQLATMSAAEFGAVDPRAFFSSVLDLPLSTEVLLVKDSANLKHIIVPYYDAPPSPGGAELGGVVVYCGCAE
jgi:hypothetical protein